MWNCDDFVWKSQYYYSCARNSGLERIKKGLMNDLLTGRKRVNVEKVLGEL